MTNNGNKKDFTRGLIDSIDNISGVLAKMERAEFLLNELVDDYTFTEKPDMALLSCNITEENITEQRQTIKWLHEYVRIQQFINMALEYTLYGRKDLGNILNSLEDRLKALRQEAV